MGCGGDLIGKSTAIRRSVKVASLYVDGSAFDPDMGSGEQSEAAKPVKTATERLAAHIVGDAIDHQCLKRASIEKSDELRRRADIITCGGLVTSVKQCGQRREEAVSNIQWQRGERRVHDAAIVQRIVQRLEGEHLQGLWARRGLSRGTA